MTLESFLRGQTVLVTGASSGIGADMARLAGRAGARVLVAARSEKALRSVADEIEGAGGAARVVVADLQATGGAAGLVAALANETVDVVVNNAGFGATGAVAAMGAAETDGMVALNVAALTHLTRAFLPGMVSRRRGGVLNVASVAGFAPLPGFAVYGATKAYVVSLTEALHAELRDTGVAATVLCPGPVATGFGTRAGMRSGFFARGEPSEAVARAGLEGLARGQRRVVPGLSNRVQVAAAALSPRGLTLRVGEALMRRAR